MKEFLHKVKLFLGIIPKEDWRFVHQESFDLPVNGEGDRKHGFYFMFFESNYGHRKYEFSSTYGKANEAYQRGDLFFVNQFNYYHETVLPWIAGRYDPGIPKYADMPEVDTMAALKGTL